MPVDQKNIESYLEGATRAERFDPYWLVTGNDEFLMLETGDKIRAAAFVAGHTERIVLELGAKSDWTTLVEAVTSYGMFDDKKIVEVRLAGAPGTKGGPVLKDLLSRIYDGVSVVFFVPTPDWSSAKAAWWTELKKQSTVVECNTPERRNLPAWLGARLARHGQSASPDTLEAFSDLVEGNLFAAHQEVESLPFSTRRANSRRKRSNRPFSTPRTSRRRRYSRPSARASPPARPASSTRSKRRRNRSFRSSPFFPCKSARSSNCEAGMIGGSHTSKASFRRRNFSAAPSASA